MFFLHEYVHNMQPPSFRCIIQVPGHWWSQNIPHTRYSLRKIANNFVKVPEIPKRKKCTGFSYCGAKIFNSLPKNIRETQNINIFKSLDWIWEEIPSYWQMFIIQIIFIFTYRISSYSFRPWIVSAPLWTVTKGHNT